MSHSLPQSPCVLSAHQDESSPPNQRPQPSYSLLVSALSGLLGMGLAATGCTTPAEEPQTNVDMAVSLDFSAPADAAMAADLSYNRKVSDTPVSFAEFSASCEKRGGLVQTTATCAGNNACKGLSYLDGVTTEHSCKGMNSCGPGMSCVDLPKDTGQTGQDIYKNGTCAPTCHAQFSPKYDDGVFTLYVRPGGLSAAAAETRFKTGSRLRLTSIIGFGVHGINDDGSAYANMPGYYTKYSRAEIERVVDYIRTLKVAPKVYEITGSKLAAGAADPEGNR